MYLTYQMSQCFHPGILYTHVIGFIRGVVHIVFIAALRCHVA